VRRDQRLTKTPSPSKSCRPTYEEIQNLLMERDRRQRKKHEALQAQLQTLALQLVRLQMLVLNKLQSASRVKPRSSETKSDKPQPSIMVQAVPQIELPKGPIAVLDTRPPLPGMDKSPVLDQKHVTTTQPMASRIMASRILDADILDDLFEDRPAPKNRAAFVRRTKERERKITRL